MNSIVLPLPPLAKTRVLWGNCREPCVCKKMSGPRYSLMPHAAGFIDPSFRNYDLWDACYRIWVSGNLLGTALCMKLYCAHLSEKEKGMLDKTEKAPYDAALGFRMPDYIHVLEEAIKEVDGAYAGEKSDEEAAESIRNLIRDRLNVNPFYNVHDKPQKSIQSTIVMEFTGNGGIGSTVLATQSKNRHPPGGGWRVDTADHAKCKISSWS